MAVPMAAAGTCFSPISSVLLWPSVISARRMPVSAWKTPLWTISGPFGILTVTS
jgi:hypothetical protein